ncbi:hypothetical protein HaLaN_28035, partial [Haematococcus lacustris]
MDYQFNHYAPPPFGGHPLGFFAPFQASPYFQLPPPPAPRFPPSKVHKPRRRKPPVAGPGAGAKQWNRRQQGARSLYRRYSHPTRPHRGFSVRPSLTQGAYTTPRTVPPAPDNASYGFLAPGAVSGTDQPRDGQVPCTAVVAVVTTAPVDACCVHKRSPDCAPPSALAHLRRVAALGSPCQQADYQLLHGLPALAGQYAYGQVDNNTVECFLVLYIVINCVQKGARLDCSDDQQSVLSMQQLWHGMKCKASLLAHLCVHCWCRPNTSVTT